MHEKIDKEEPKESVGRWRFFVVFAAFWMMILLNMTIITFSLYESRLLMGVGSPSSTTVSWIFNTNLFMLHVIQIFIGPLCDAFGHRPVAFWAGFILSSSIVMSGFLEEESALILFATFSLLGGSSCGTLNAVSAFIIPLYFRRHKGAAMTFVYIGFATSQMIGPQIIHFLQQTFGRKNGTFILGALILNTCACAMVYHPVKWHTHKPKHPESCHVQFANINERTIKQEIPDSTIDTTQKRQMPSQGSENLIDIIKKVLKLTSTNLTFVRSFRVLIICLSSAICVINQVNFLMIIPFVFKERGIGYGKTTFYMSIIGISNLIFRIVLLFVIDRIPVSMKWHSLFAMFASFLAPLVLSFIHAEEPLIIFCMVIASLSSGIITILPLVILDYVGKEHFSGVYGVYGLIAAGFSLTVGPIIGVLVDVTSNYVASLRFLSGTSLMAASLWAFMPAAVRGDEKRKVLQCT